MTEQDRSERIQRALELFSEMMRPPAPSTDEAWPEEFAAYLRPLTDDLASLGLSREELDEVQLLYFEAQSAFAPLNDERAAKLAYLVKHAPGAPSIEAAIEQLSDEQLDEYMRLTGEDL